MPERLIKSDRGFTLIEIIGVMVIVGLLTSISATKVLNTNNAAKREALSAAVSDLNSREMLAWGRIKLSDGNWINDDQVFALIDTDLGPQYRWISVDASGGTLEFEGFRSRLSRLPSSASRYATWKAN